MFTKRVILSLLVPMILSGCGTEKFHTEEEIAAADPAVQSHIIDGVTINDPTTKASRSVVAVELLDSDRNVIGYCTGVLIGKNTVLSAAHCLSSHVVRGVENFNIVFATQTKTKSIPIRRIGYAFTTHSLYRC